ATPAKTAAAASPAKAFAALSDRFIKGIAENSPVEGTQLGDHRFDDKLPDISPAGHARTVASLKATLAALNGINRAGLTRDAQVDAAMLDNALRFQLWQAESLQSWQWDIQSYNEIAGNALYLLAARDFAPWSPRLKAATARMEAMPAFLAQVRAVIVPARVPDVYASTVAERNAGIVLIAETMLAPHKGELAPADQQRFDAALAGLKAAVAEHQKWLNTVLVPQAKGDFRLGVARYDEKIKFALGGTLTRPEIKARALAEVTHVRAQMYDLARQVLAGKPGAPALPDQPTADEQQRAIEAALALTYQQRPARAALRDAATGALAQATDFVRAKNLVTMPDAPVRVIDMPKFQQGYAVAYDDPPGPLEKGQANFFAVAAVPDQWTDAQATSFLSEYNNFMVQDLAIHEAMPGHYLQLWHANKNPSLLRAVLSSGPFVEGWAVYAEGMMADEGYMNGDPLFKLTVLKMRLRSVTNSLLDIGIQAEGMTHEQALDLMMKTAFQQEREAEGKWLRARLSSAQLLSYFSGYAEHMALREEAKRRWGAKFNLHDYNDAVLAHGSPPARYVRELMFGLPIG
ncbi:MAG: DUF885 domain-containing protein, partial [Sphingomonas sp.]